MLERRHWAKEAHFDKPHESPAEPPFMKLLFVHQHLGAQGGAEANIQLSARELQNRGHEIALLHGSGTGKSEDEWRRTFTERFDLAERAGSGKAHEAVRHFQPELIYVHNLDDLEVMEVLLDSGLPIVRMVHDHGMYCMRGYKYNYFTRVPCSRPASFYCVFPCLAFVARDRSGRLPVKWVSYAKKRKEIKLNQRCQRLVVYSQYVKEELLRNGFDAQRIEIHVPIRCWGTEAQVSSFNDRNLILFAGQIVRGKGVDVLLEALTKVKTPFECIVLGDGNHREYCERLCRNLGLGGRVHFQGFVMRNELRSFYLETSVFVVSSLWPEPFGLVGPEAMRYGLPVVAFDAGGVREWLIDGETGYLVPWMDTDLFAARIEQLLANKELARSLGRRGLERVNHEYDAVRQIDSLEGMFRRVRYEARESRLNNSMAGFAE